MIDDPRKALWMYLAGLFCGVALTVGVQSCDFTPEPDVPVVVVDEKGPRIVLLVHESTDDSPAMRDLSVALVNGEPAEYLKSKGHRLYSLDDDAKDEHGNPTPLLEKHRSDWQLLKMPFVLILDSSQKLLHKQELSDLTPDAVLAILKAHGG